MVSPCKGRRIQMDTKKSAIFDHNLAVPRQRYEIETHVCNRESCVLCFIEWCHFQWPWLAPDYRQTIPISKFYVDFRPLQARIIMRQHSTDRRPAVDILTRSYILENWRWYRFKHMKFTDVYNLLAGRRRLLSSHCYHCYRPHHASQRPYLNTHVHDAKLQSFR